LGICITEPTPAPLSHQFCASETAILKELCRLRSALYGAGRRPLFNGLGGNEPFPGNIDSQSAKTTEAGGPRGYDAGKKTNGRKRHALVDTDGRGLVLEPHPASIQDRDGGGPLLRVSRCIFPFIQRVFADSGYAGEKVSTATLIAVEIVRKNPDQIGFAVNPRRWVVERHAARAADRSCFVTFETDP
jgi:hypothetical protein